MGLTGTAAQLRLPRKQRPAGDAERLLRGKESMPLPKLQHLQALLGIAADHLPIQGTICNRLKALYPVSNPLDPHPALSPEECRMFLALVSGRTWFLHRKFPRDGTRMPRAGARAPWMSALR